MKLSEKYFNAVVRKINTSFSAKKAIEQVQTYGHICRLEGELDYREHIAAHRQTFPLEDLKKQLDEIAKAENLEQ